MRRKSERSHSVYMKNPHSISQLDQLSLLEQVPKSSRELLCREEDSALQKSQRMTQKRGK